MTSSSKICQSPGCGKPVTGNLACPTCIKLGLSPTYFCSQGRSFALWLYGLHLQKRLFEVKVHSSHTAKSASRTTTLPTSKCMPWRSRSLKDKGTCFNGGSDRMGLVCLTGMKMLNNSLFDFDSSWSPGIQRFSCVCFFNYFLIR